ncbi:MAG TPA: hypothetical protein VGD60_16660 [Candidatus Acidoferrales bacterium]
MNSHPTSTERRRSERAFESLPLVVRGVDLLGQPFEERTTTLAFNSHGCRYSSTHHLPRNCWVTLELPAAGKTQRDSEPLRARVAWVQRPHSIRDFFQIAVELETPADVWKAGAPLEGSSRGAMISPAEPERIADSSIDPPSIEAVTGETSAAIPAPLASDSPLLRELRSELQRQIQEAAATAAQEAQHKVAQAAEENERKLSDSAEESFRKWRQQLDKLQNQARDEYSASLSVQQSEFLHNVKAEMDATIRQAHDLVSQLHHQTETLRSTSDLAHEKSSQVAQSLLQLEAAEAARAARPPAGQSREELDAQEGLAAGWRTRLQSEMGVAQKQWNELLQSSLDSNLHHMVGQISAHSQEILKAAEKKMTERLGELREPFAKAAEEARDTIAGIQASLNQEVQRARGSLTEVEQVAARTKEISAQLEAASHDTLNQLHRRLEKILDTHTAEMNRRAEGISANLSQTIGSSLDSVGQQFMQRTIAETEGSLAPHLQKVPALLHELESREVQTEETLRVHRERLRQLAENSQREVDAQVTAATANLHANFEAARRDALTKWSEELDASGVRAAHSAAEALGRTSEWFQQEARARLQVLVEQSLVTAGADLSGKAAVASQNFESQLAAQAGNHLAQIRDQVEGVATETAGRARSEMDRAAEAAAASFGEVLHAESERQSVEFRAATAGIQRERTEEFEHKTQDLLHKLDVNAWSSMESFRARMAEQLESATSDGRGALRAEFTSALENFQAERETHKQLWAEHLERLSGEATGHYQEKLQTAGDAWVTSSVRRLNEHGQNGIESLLKSADQSLRDSFAKVFEGLSEMLRDRSANAAGIGNAAGFGQIPNRENSEGGTPRNSVI